MPEMAPLTCNVQPLQSPNICFKGLKDHQLKQRMADKILLNETSNSKQTMATPETFYVMEIKIQLSILYAKI